MAKIVKNAEIKIIQKRKKIVKKIKVKNEMN